MVAHRESRLHTSLIGVFAFLLLGIAAVNYFFYKAESSATRQQAMAQLSAIADLKAQQIDTWRRERLGDASTFRDNPALAPAIERWLVKRIAGAERREIQEWLYLYLGRSDYREAALLDANGEVLTASTPGFHFVSSPELLNAAVKIEGPVFSDLYSQPDGKKTWTC